jgi:hypothetical protein
MHFSATKTNETLFQSRGKALSESKIIQQEFTLDYKKQVETIACGNKQRPRKFNRNKNAMRI